ncbi:Acetylcholinesterase [Arthrobotrys entomopaga]|nr:Acetylcholinesterase [Arthrobotrys entomopaga]
MKFFFSSLILLGAAAVNAIPPDSSTSYNYPNKPPISRTAPSVRIANGTVTGIYNPQWKQDFFLSVPYAEPPLGNLRFRPPQYIKTKRNVFAQEYGPHCYGYGGDQWGYNVSENCLTLNVVRPAGLKPHTKLPVAVWIHGGGFFEGGAGDKRYNLTWLVNQSVKLNTPMIAVSLKDQRLALHWVKENIAAFGGDASKITILGESAGAIAVSMHQIAFGGRDDGLFRGAIMESGSAIFYLAWGYPDAYQENYDTLLDAVSCTDAVDSLQCLRGVEVGKLNEALNTTNAAVFTAVVDGAFVPDSPALAYKDGRYVKVPTIIGTNSDEGASFGELGYNTTQQIFDYLSTTTKYKNATIGRLLEVYDESVSVPDASNFTHPDEGTILYGSQYHRVAAIVGDQFFIHGKRYIAERLSSDNVNVWTYRFRTRPNGFADWLRAPHFSEVAFVFYNVHSEGYETGIVWPGESADLMGGPDAEKYIALSDFMSKSWVRFVVSGDPSVGIDSRRDVKWLKYKDGKGASQIVFDIAPNSTYMETDDYRKEGIQLMIDSMMQNGE